MMQKELRLTKSLFKDHKTKLIYRGDLFDVACMSTLPTKRVACVVAKKRMKRAVDRNYTKRRVYEAVRINGVFPRFAVVIYPKPPILTSAFSDICVTLRQVFATLQ
jgi:ribonuclease P protein component